MNGHRLDTTIGPDGSILLEGLPVHAGDQVEVIVRAKEPGHPKAQPSYPLRGKPYRFEDPFSPAVPPEEWDANQ